MAAEHKAAVHAASTIRKQRKGILVAKHFLLCEQSRVLTQGRAPLTFNGDLPASVTLL